MRRILVTGSRKWTNRRAIWTALETEYLVAPRGIVVVHGAAEGADDIADRWAWCARQMGRLVQVEAHAPNYDKHGKRAPLVRNQDMADAGAFVCLAFPLEGGAGTRHMMSRAIAAGIEVINYGYQPYTQQARDFVAAYG
ncbi:gp62 protein [Mycobacteroides abscessus subsp. abscessus]|uniref:DUF2493 domain-containing protein n=1 Tax=Mycobacteroides abscessus TaxID=36809 RepID=UPI000927A8FE|nr:DUF2493 domain-containing protein [Mycobacteroides abscessus]SHS98831.1 gp62 protein [Mycobacteroides abscessus subsp. abscessus]SLK64523.1 gp62 protein [Mycobacteroides abscessus subsp. abscessus]